VIGFLALFGLINPIGTRPERWQPCTGRLECILSSHVPSITLGHIKADTTWSIDGSDAPYPNREIAVKPVHPRTSGTAAALALAGLAICAALPVAQASAQQATDERSSDGGPMSENYVLERRGDTFVRIDKATGEMTVCTVRNGQLTCRVSVEERSYFLDEIAGLEERIKSLEDRVASLEEVNAGPAAPGATAKPEAGLPEDKDQDAAGANPQEEDAKPRTAEEEKLERDFDRAMDYMSRAMRRFFDVVKEFKNDAAGEKS
jgi:hypothetical protein